MFLVHHECLVLLTLNTFMHMYKCVNELVCALVHSIDASHLILWENALILTLPV